MASLNSYHYTTTISTFLFIILLHHMLHPVSTSNRLHSANPPRELLFEEKNKIGSMPPSCHSKCNECHPCMAIKVPSLPTTHDSIPPKVSAMEKWLQGNMYSNYKPLGWKCHCGEHFFNP